MSETNEAKSKETVIPAMRYRDAHEAIEWLGRAFGFAKSMVIDGPDGKVLHAQLRLGGGMIMLSSTSTEGEMAALMTQPEGAGGRETQFPYLVVADAAAVYKTAKAAGAEIFQELQEMPYGGKAFGCRDPEGHLWSVGEYDPWADA